MRVFAVGVPFVLAATLLCAPAVAQVQPQAPAQQQYSSDTYLRLCNTFAVPISVRYQLSDVPGAPPFDLYVYPKSCRTIGLSGYQGNIIIGGGAAGSVAYGKLWAAAGTVVEADFRGECYGASGEGRVCIAP